MKIYFTLQGKRLLRGLKDLGINPYLGLLGSIGIFVGVSYLFFKKIGYPQYIYPLLALLSVYPLGNVHRNEFLKNMFTRARYRNIRLLENNGIALPFALVLLFKEQYLFALITLCLSTVCSFYNRVARSGFVVPSPFSRRPFEFTVGFRTSYLLLLLLYILTGIALYVHNFGLGLVALGGVLLTCMNFLSTAEPEFYVWVHAQTPRGFLLEKTKTALWYSLLLSLPLAVPLVGFFPSNGFIVAGLLVVGLLDITMSVVAKYAGYPEQPDLLHFLKMALGLIFPPALLLLIPHFYTRSLKHLNVYLQ